MKRAWHAMEWLSAAWVPVALIAINVWLLTSETYVRWELARVAAPAGMARADRDASGLAIGDFVAGRSDDSLALARALEGRAVVAQETDTDEVWPGDEIGLRRYAHVADEYRHMRDVRALVRLLWQFVVVTALINCAQIGIVMWVSPHRRAEYIRWVHGFAARGGLLTLALVALVGAGIAAGWERTFVWFHRVLFPGGNWAFPADSLLIQIFPDRFWFEAATILVVMTTVEAVALVWWGRRARSSAPVAPASAATRAGAVG